VFWRKTGGVPTEVNGHWRASPKIGAVEVGQTIAFCRLSAGPVLRGEQCKISRIVVVLYSGLSI